MSSEMVLANNTQSYDSYSKNQNKTKNQQYKQKPLYIKMEIFVEYIPWN